MRKTKEKNESLRNLLKHQNSAQFSIFLRSSSDQRTVRLQIKKKICGTSGPSFWIRANCRWFGQRGVEKKSHKTPSFIVPNFYHASFLQQGCQTCTRCAPKNSSRYKLYSENEIISTVIGLKAEMFSKFQKNVREFEQKLFGSVVRTKIYISQCLFCEKYTSGAII